MGQGVSSLLTRVLRTILYTSAIIIVLLALALNAARILLPRVHNSRLYLENWASAAVSRPVSFDSVTAAWRGMGPVFEFSDVTVHSPDKKSSQLHMNKLDISISWWQSLLNRRLVPGRIEIAGTKFHIKQLAMRKYLVNGVPVDLTSADASANISNFSWLFHTGFYLSDSEIYLQDMHSNTLHFTPLQLAVKTDGDKDLVAGVITFKQTIPTTLRFSLQIYTEELAKNKLRMSAYLAGTKVSLLQWQNFLEKWMKLPEKVRGGRADMQLWLDIKDSKIQNVSSVINLHYFGLRGWHLKQGIFFPNVTIDSSWTALQNGWLFRVNKLHAHLPGLDWPDNSLSWQRVRLPNGKLRSVFNIGFMRLQDLPVIEKQLQDVPAEIDTWFKRFNPSGDVHDLRLTWNQDIGITALQANCQDATWTQWSKVPGMQHVNLQIKTNRRYGSALLTSTGGKFTMPSLFAQPLRYNYLHIPLKWNAGKGGWQLLTNYQAAFPGVNDNGQLRVVAAKSKSPQIDFLSGFTVPDAGQINQLFPKKVMGKVLYSWLTHAFISGQVKSGIMLWRGPVSSFPYLDHSGHFEILANVRNMDLHYVRNWPDMYKADAKIIFDNRSMYADLLAGNLNGIHIKTGNAQIQNLQDPHLYVSAKLFGDLSAATGYVRKTPMDLAKTFKNMDFSGPLTLALNFDIPLKHQGPLHSSGVVTTSNGNLLLKNWKLPVSNFAGTIKFHDKNLTAKKITASIFGKPTVITINTKKDKSHTYLAVHINGAYSGSQLRKYLQIKSSKYWSGDAKYNAKLKVYSGDATSSLAVVIDGAGNKFNLPGYFNKLATDPTQINVNVLMPQDSRLQFRVAYGRRWNVASRLDLSKKIAKFSGVNLQIGAKSAPMPRGEGIRVAGYLPQIDFDTWLKWLSKNKLLQTASAAVYNKSSSSQIKSVDISIGSVRYGKDVFHKVAVSAQPIKSSWRLALNAPVAKGVVYVPNNFRTGILKGTLQYLNLNISDKSQSKFSFDKLPNLSLNINSLAWSGKTYGGVSIESRSSPGSFKILRLVANAQNLNFTGSGSWVKLRRGQLSTLRGKVTSKDFGAALTQYKLTDLLDDGAGYIDLDLNWPDAMNKVTDANLTGSIKVNITDGRITKISKSAESEMGIGRVLSLLSLQTLPRRLTLNFDDLFKSGYSFNNWTGSWKLQQGIAATNNSVVDGAAAKVLLQGKLDFPKKRYDLYLRVQPHLTGSLPVIATVIGTPVAGAITWAFNKILIGPLVGRVMQSSFKLDGSWVKPQVRQLPAPKSHKAAS